MLYLIMYPERKLMTQWRIKKISDLTKVSVRMLHHYDKIGLLKPSMRSSNGYRWYSEQDLAKLQQIIALKFFGFSLRQIKTMLQKQLEIREHLLYQKEMLQDQQKELQQAQDALEITLNRYETSKNLNWNNLITLIERYHMINELKKTWAGKLNKEQQDNYLKLKQKYPKQTDAWDKMIIKINNQKVGDPEGADGKKAVEICLELSKAIMESEKTTEYKKVSSKQATDLLTSIDKFRSEGIPLNPEGNMWFAKAQTAYHLECWNKLYKEIIKNIDSDPSGQKGKTIANKWRELILQHCNGSPIDFCFGTKLLMQTAQSKLALKNLPEQTPEEKQQIFKDNTKMLMDPVAMHWISTALKKH